MRKNNTETLKKILPIASIITVIAIWQFIASFIVQNKFILPGFTDVAGAFIELLTTGTLGQDLAVSLLHFGIGMAGAIIIGIPVGVAMGWFEKIDIALNPIIEILRPIPPLAWIPFAIVWFGLTHQSAGFIIFIGAVFPVLINTYTGFKNIPKIFVEAGKVLGCNKNLSLIRYIAFPSAIPSIVAGIRVSMGIGWMCLVGAEIFGAGTGQFGLGKNLWKYYSLHNMPNVVVYMIILGIIGLVIDIIFRHYVDKQMLKWQKGTVA